MKNINRAPSEKMREGHQGPVARVFFIRHSQASYGNYADKLASDEPESALEIDAQREDLPQKGIELAKENAPKFFSRFNPQKDIFYIVSSDQMRALETAKIYADTAKEMGFEVVKHEREDPKTSEVLPKTGSDIAGRVGEGDVRTLSALSLHMKNQVFGNVFNPPAYLPPINWEKVDPKTKEVFDKAREIVLADDKRSWGSNFYAHAEEVKKLIPEMETPQELHETQFKAMQRLAKWARKRVPEEKHLNVVGFGHENYMGIALDEHTGEHTLGNTEAVEMNEDGSLTRV